MSTQRGKAKELVIRSEKDERLEEKDENSRRKMERKVYGVEWKH